MLPPLRGKDRMIAANAREIARRTAGNPATRTAPWWENGTQGLSASGSQAGTAPGPNDNPETVAREDRGPDGHREIRRQVFGQVNAAWLARRQANPGPISVAEYNQFREDIESRMEAAVLAGSQPGD